MLRQTVKVEGYEREVIPVVSKVLFLTKKEPRRMVHLMRHASRKFKIWMSKRSCYLAKCHEWEC